MTNTTITTITNEDGNELVAIAGRDSDEFKIVIADEYACDHQGDCFGTTRPLHVYAGQRFTRADVEALGFEVETLR